MNEMLPLSHVLSFRTMQVTWTSSSQPVRALTLEQQKQYDGISAIHKQRDRDTCAMLMQDWEKKGRGIFCGPTFHPLRWGEAYAHGTKDVLEGCNCIGRKQEYSWLGHLTQLTGRL
jgi:hypothetical protein